MTYYAFSALFNSITSLILFFVVFSKRQKNTVFRTFLALCFSAFIWSFFYFFWQLADDKTLALFWCRALMFGATLIPVFYLHFVLSFLKIESKNKTKLFFIYLFGLLSIIINFTDLLVKDVVPSDFVAYWPIGGPYLGFFLFVWVLVVVYIIFLLLEAKKNAQGIRKKQIHFVLIGTVLSYALGSTNYFLWYGINIKPFGNIFSSLYVLIIGYSIISYRFMDIKVVLRRSSVYVTSLLATLLPALSLKYFFDKFFPEYSYWIDFVIIVFSISAFPYFKEKIYKLANKYFFSSLYDSKQVVKELSNVLGTTLEPTKIYEAINRILGDALHNKAICFITSGPKNDLLVSYNNGFKLPDRIKKDPIYERIFKDYVTVNKLLVTDELKNNQSLKTRSVFKVLKKDEIEIIVPLVVKNKPIGAIALAIKESGEAYNNEDLDLLKIVGSQTSISLENALLYEETKKFNVKLTKEVERATHELKNANEELKKLDQAKSDFISIASHQLRTPLTVIKGYGSMMLEGSFGKMSEPIEENLQKIYDSNERLITLVEDLLNISRIESGRLQFNWEIGQLEEMVSSVVEELKPNATKKGLSFKYTAPATPLPAVKLDKTKLRQVAINLIDNAIKYTEKGGLIVTLIKEADKLKFCVADTGMGISQEGLPNLFKKFSRGEQTSIIHTEGTGLGLYVGKMMVEAHGGNIWAESEGEKKGSKFCFEIPISTQQTTKQQTASNKQQG